MNITQKDGDLGTAYAMKVPVTRTELTSVARGTPMGELLRRYWHPIGLVCRRRPIRRGKCGVSARTSSCFATARAAPACVHPRCAIAAPRSTTARSRSAASAAATTAGCSTSQGHCLEQPCEPERRPAQRDKVRQPWYPVQERYGLVFAYLGPPEKKPVLPRYDCLEELDARRIRRGRRFLDRRRRPGRSSPATGCSTARTSSIRSTCRSCTARSAARSSSADGRDAEGEVRDARRAASTCDRSARRTTARSSAASPRWCCRRCAWCPTRAWRNYGQVESIGWVLPIDDTSSASTSPGASPKAGELGRMRSKWQRQVLVGPERGGAPALPRRLRGAGRPGRDHAAFRRASRPERPRHPDDAAYADRAARGAGGRARSRQRVL